MLHTLREGDLVQVWPLPGVEVPSAPPVVLETPGGLQVLPARPVRPGDKLKWTAWLHERAREGSLLFSNPGEDGKSHRRAANVRHPHEAGADGKPAAAGGAHSDEELACWQAMAPDHDHADKAKRCGCGHKFGLSERAVADKAKAKAKKPAEAGKE